MYYPCSENKVTAQLSAPLFSHWQKPIFSRHGLFCFESISKRQILQFYVICARSVGLALCQFILCSDFFQSR